MASLLIFARLLCGKKLQSDVIVRRVGGGKSWKLCRVCFSTCTTRRRRCRRRGSVWAPSWATLPRRLASSRPPTPDPDWARAPTTNQNTPHTLMDCIAIFANGAATKFFNSPVTYFLLRLFDWRSRDHIRPPAQGDTTCWLFGEILLLWKSDFPQNVDLVLSFLITMKSFITQTTFYEPVRGQQSDKQKNQ